MQSDGDTVEVAESKLLSLRRSNLSGHGGNETFISLVPSHMIGEIA